MQSSELFTVFKIVLFSTRVFKLLVQLLEYLKRIYDKLILKAKQIILLKFLGFLGLVITTIWLGFNAHLADRVFSPVIVIGIFIAVIGVMIQKGRERRG